MTNSPCKDCETRYPGCHSKCELYLDWQQVHRAELTTIKINKLKDKNNTKWHGVLKLSHKSHFRGGRMILVKSIKVFILCPT